MLHFTVIAGPNGAGKSTFSANLSRAETRIFDPDLEKYALEKQYPDITDDAIQSALTDRYHRFEAEVFSKQLNLTVETNLRNEFLAERASFFKEAGYQTRLIFMLLPDVESSMDRVNLRVAQKGHFVNAANIRDNFEKSLENLVKVAPNFDRVMLVCAASSYQFKSKPELVLTAKDGEIVKINEQMPAWAEPIAFTVANAINRDNLRNRGLRR